MNLEKIKWILLAIYLILAGLVLLGVSLGGIGELAGSRFAQGAADFVVDGHGRFLCFVV